MKKIKNSNILTFIVKMLLMLLLNIFTILVSIEMNLGIVIIAILSVYIIFNIYVLLIKKTEKLFIYLKYFDAILFTLFLLTLIAVFIFLDEVELNSWGALIIYPLGLSIINFLIAFFIDIKIFKKNQDYPTSH